jgi:farnesyl diphosphate synthase
MTTDASGAAAPSFPDRLAAVAEAVEARLAELLAFAEDGEAAVPAPLAEAMRYAVLGGGKRFRPFLLVETARLFGADQDGALTAAAAIESLHCYSLAHDDLPAMDDDDLRRGRPTLHRAFDEATAILAGDALLTAAFAWLARPEVHADPGVRIALVAALARAAGAAGMVGGQVLDLAAERDPPDDAGILSLQAMKTGALLAAAVEMGALLGGAGQDDRIRLGAYAATLGLAFQLADDLLDVDGSAAAVGKRTGKDAARGKATLVSARGTAWARARLAELVGEAIAALEPYGRRAGILVEAARFVAERRS